MARKLYVYVDYAPNKGEQTHYVYSSIANFLAAIETHKIFTLDYPNYRIINGEVILSLKTANVTPVLPLTFAQLQRCAYVVDVDESESYIRCYFVNSVYDKSGIGVMRVALDNWGTFIKNIAFETFHVRRCTRKVNNTGRFDEVSATIGEPLVMEKASDVTETLSNYCAVFLASVNLSPTPNVSVTKTSLYYVSLQDIYDLAHTQNPAMDAFAITEKVIDWAGGINSIVTSGLNTAPAEVLGLWIVPKAVITQGSFSDKFNSSCNVTNFSNVPLTANVVAPNKKDVSFSLDHYGTNNLYKDIMPAFHVEAGTPFNSYPLKRFASETSITYRFIFTNSAVKVFLVQGNEELNITEGFEVEMTTNNASTTSLMNISKVVEKFAKAVALIGGGAATGNAAGAVMGGVSFIGSEIAGAASKQQITRGGMTAGEGALTYSYGVTNKDVNLRLPYCLIITPSIADEVRKAEMRGANYDYYDNSLSSIQNDALLITGSTYRNNETFMLCDEMEVSGTNEEAEAYVKSEFARGIWYKVI